MKEMNQAIQESLEFLRGINPLHQEIRSGSDNRRHKLQKVLIANRGEIAKRFFLALKEEGIPSVAIVTNVDMGQSWYQQADEVIFIGDGKHYTNIPIVIAATMLVQANAIYPGYGFLSENASFVDAIQQANQTFGKEIIFMGPSADIMNRVGDKLAARKLAKEQGVPLFQGSEAIASAEEAKTVANRIGYPVMVKLSAGGGGKGMLPVYKDADMDFAVESSQRTGRNLYQDDTFYLEKFIEQPVHMEVQIFNGTAIGLRKCAVQRRNQKVLEETGDAFLDSHMVLSMLAAAENMARISGYSQGAGAGTVEFLYDAASQRFGFLEMNVRLQVEHPVTDQSLKIDLAKWQILFFDGREREIPYQDALEQRFTNKTHAIEARIYAEDPENDYAPAPGIIQELDLPTFNGIRSDFGFKKGDTILPDYDPMIGKVIAYGDTRREAITRMERALSELYVQGILTNINQLLHIVRAKKFIEGDYTNLILPKNPHLEKPEYDNATLQKGAIFAALGEHAQAMNTLARQTLHSRDLENTVQLLQIHQPSSSYAVKLYGHEYTVDLVQTALDNYYVYLNSTYMGEVELLPKLEGDYDFLVRFGLQSYPIRLDSRPAFTILRVNDEHGKTQYLRAVISAIGSGDTSDPAGMIRSPFQATFVTLAKESKAKEKLVSIGAIVEKDDPIMVISAMKMETTVRAPLSGRISYILEEGDLNRLQLGKTADGLIIGKSISEGEVLFVIEEEEQKSAEAASAEAEQKPIEEILEITRNRPLLLQKLFSDELQDTAPEQPEVNIPILLKLLRAHFLGFQVNPMVLERLSAALAYITPEQWRLLPGKNTQDDINSIINFYLNIKQLYSATLNANISSFAELNTFVMEWEHDSFVPSASFKLNMGNLFRTYQINDWLHKPASEKSSVKLAFVSMLRAYNSCLNYPYIINNLVAILGNLSNLQRRMSYTLKRLIFIEQSELNDFVAETAIKVLRTTPFPRLSRDAIPWVSMQYMRDYRRMVKDIFGSFGDSGTEIAARMKASLQGQETSGVPLQPWMEKDAQARLALLADKWLVQKLYSPYDFVSVYQITSKEETTQSHYLVYGFLPENSFSRDEQGQIIGSQEFDHTSIEATRILRAYQNLKPLKRNSIEIFVTRSAMEVDLGSHDPAKLNYFTFNRLGMNVLRFFTHVSLSYSVFHVDFINASNGQKERKSLKMALEKGRLLIDLFLDIDARNPYSQKPADARVQKMLERDKWPADVWARECFDHGIYEEIIIKSIDEITVTDAKTGKQGFKPVGSHIYSGKVGGRPALFYIKDSRIAGGATGDLEGLKYVAASYIAYLQGLPFYVWNDGAGANIREGMVSLNRAGEGFLMNALLGGRVTPDQFQRFTRFNPDPRLQQLFAELDAQLGLENNGLPKADGNTFTVAVGIGSSTGLDVYGSSQSAIQVIVDTDESYRVLTGSNVIKSVTGEDMTNYEIGGAGVMSKWTGTVDYVANDKVHLITFIRRLQETFVSQSPGSAIRRPKGSTFSESSQIVNPEIQVLSETIIHQNVDADTFIPFKEQWYGSANVVGGFAQLGGHRVLVMGPRSNFGLRTFPAITKAKELLRTAYKTGAHQVLFFGKNWYYETISEAENSMRARMDFLKDVQKKSGVRVHIISHHEGLHRLKINCLADAIIFIRSKNLHPDILEKASQMATFSVDSAAEAFDLSCKIIDLLSNRQAAPGQSGGVPSIPADPALPYDIIKSVIEPVFDSGSFIEFFADMNRPSGPGLITGFARLAGKSVAIIADQPIIMGGAPDAPGTEKYRMFTELVHRNGMPLVMLSNAPGFVPGVKQERLRIQQIGGESLDVNILSTMPVVSVILNQNYGGRQIHAFSKFIRPGIVYLALRNAVMAVMGAKASFDLFMGAKYNELLAQGKEQEAVAMRVKYVEEYNSKAAAYNDAFGTGILDWLIEEIATLREHIIEGMKVAEIRASEVLEYRSYYSLTMADAAEAITGFLRVNKIQGDISTDGSIVVHKAGQTKTVSRQDVEKFLMGYGTISIFQS